MTAHQAYDAEWHEWEMILLLSFTDILPLRQPVFIKAMDCVFVQ